MTNNHIRITVFLAHIFICGCHFGFRYDLKNETGETIIVTASRFRAPATEHYIIPKGRTQYIPFVDGDLYVQKGLTVYAYDKFGLSVPDKWTWYNHWPFDKWITRCIVIDSDCVFFPGKRIADKKSGVLLRPSRIFDIRKSAEQR